MNENKQIYPSVGQSWGIVGIAILSSFLFSPISSILYKIIGKELAFLIHYIVSMGVTFKIADSIRYKKTGIINYNFSLSSLKITALISISTIAIQIGIATPIINLLPMPQYMQKMFLEFDTYKGPFSFIAIVIAAPVFEELIFRGIILDGLLQKYRPIESIVLSSILFGIVHLNPWQFIGAFTLGMFSGWIYYKTKNLSLSILIHSVNNLVAFISTYFKDANRNDRPLTDVYGGSTNMILIIIGAICVLIIGVFLLNKELNRSES